MKKLLVHMHGSAIGGSETQIKQLADRLERRGVETDVICSKGPVRSYLEQHVHQIWDEPEGSENWASVVEKSGAEAGVAIQGNIFRFASACKLKSIPTVWMSGSPSCAEQPVVTLASALFDRSIVPSQFLLDRQRPFFKDRVTHIPCGIDTTEFRLKPHTLRRRLRSWLGIPAEAFVLGYAARFTAYKRHTDLAEILERLKEIDPKFHLLLIGGAEQSNETWRGFVAEIEKRGLKSSVTSIQSDPDHISSLYSLMNVFLSPAEEEGLGCAILEAMASEVPIVATHSGGSAELFAYKEIGASVPVGDVDAFLKEILALYRSPKRCAQLGAHARQVVIDYYSLDQLEEGFLEALREVCE